jgi:hypothetical protein
VVREEKLKTFREAIKAAGIEEKNNAPRKHEFRIHSIPGSATVEDISNALEYKLGTRPLTITLRKYKTSEKQVASCTCSREMYSALENIYTLFIRF